MGGWSVANAREDSSPGCDLVGMAVHVPLLALANGRRWASAYAAHRGWRMEVQPGARFGAWFDRAVAMAAKATA